MANLTCLRDWTCGSVCLAGSVTSSWITKLNHEGNPLRFPVSLKYDRRDGRQKKDTQVMAIVTRVENVIRKNNSTRSQQKVAKTTPT
jgi:hypothetical protein